MIPHLLPALSSATLATADTASTTPSFNWVGLVVIVVVGAAAWPLYRRLRDRISRQRRERWAREEGWAARYTPDNDPDLLRQPDPTEPAGPSRPGARDARGTDRRAPGRGEGREGRERGEGGGILR